jgi:hypothetical protein
MNCTGLLLQKTSRFSCTLAVTFELQPGRWPRVGFLTQSFLASAIFNIQTRKGRKNNILINQIAGPYVHKRPNQIPKKLTKAKHRDNLYYSTKFIISLVTVICNLHSFNLTAICIVTVRFNLFNQYRVYIL